MGTQTRWPGSGLAPVNVIDPLSRSWLPRGRLARRTRGLLLGGVWLRYVTWRQARELDEQLVRGAVALANAPYDPVRMGRPALRRAQVQENRELLLKLADRLTAGGSRGVQGLAITSLLVGDGVSPLYSKAARDSLNTSISHALVALD